MCPCVSVRVHAYGAYTTISCVIPWASPSSSFEVMFLIGLELTQYTERAGPVSPWDLLTAPQHWDYMPSGPSTLFPVWFLETISRIV